jgi:hypothetical protein
VVKLQLVGQSSMRKFACERFRPISPPSPPEIKVPPRLPTVLPIRLVTLWLNWFTRSLGWFEPLPACLNRPYLDPFPSPIVGTFAVPLFTTPRLTRKRKAAEAAIADNDQSSPKAATRATNTGNATVTAATAAAPSDPKTRSKQVSSETVTSQDTERGSSTSSASLNRKKSRIATPATTTGSMDSDDDFMSDVSSAEDFLDTQGSEDESLGEGTCC